MDVFETIKAMMVSSGLSVRKLGANMGRSPYYAKTILYGRKSVPSSSILSEIADTCGYDLLVRNRDDRTEILIDPPSKEETD